MCKKSIPKKISAIKKNFPKNIIFPKGFLLYRAKKPVFVIKWWGFLKIFKIRSGSYLGQAYQHMYKKTELKSRWTVPLSLLFIGLV
jgi:hypothetical protein